MSAPGQIMNLTYHTVTDADQVRLAEWNHQLIEDEGHRNPMTVPQLGERMKKWFEGEYSAVVFSVGEPVGYALFKQQEDSIYPRQFFYLPRPTKKRPGLGRVQASAG